VERTTDIQYRPDQTVPLNILGDSPEALTAQIVTLSGRRASLKVHGNIAAGTAVRIDLNDSMLLGEIAGCVSGVSGFVAHVEVIEAIPSMSDLARLVSAVMNETRTELRESTTARAAGAR
jgi:hypothetical protein